MVSLAEHLRIVCSCGSHTLVSWVLQDDRVLEVLRCRSNRVLLLTNGHVALLACTSKPQDTSVMYKSKWTLRLHDVQNVRGKLVFTDALRLLSGTCFATYDKRKSSIMLDPAQGQCNCQNHTDVDFLQILISIAHSFAGLR